LYSFLTFWVTVGLLFVFPSAIFAAPPLPTDYGDYFVDQDYLFEFTGGIGAPYAWTKPGGKGANVTIIDVEFLWNFLHVEFLSNPPAPISISDPYEGYCTDRAINHGTAVLGVLGAAHDNRGVEGIVPEAQIGLVPVGAPTSAYSLPWAVRLALLLAQPGDVVLIEQEKIINRDDLGAKCKRKCRDLNQES
jgi:hypothetical protein